MPMDVSSDAFPGAYFLIFVVYGILALVVHIAFASAVYRDAQVQPVKFVSAGIWGLATLIGGVVTAAVYWVIHHSSLATSTSRSSEE